MRRILFLIIAFTFATSGAWAQFTLNEKHKLTQDQIKFSDSEMKSIKTSTDYESEARERLERKRIRKERNYIQITPNIQGSMWAANKAWGGDNSLTVLAWVNFNHRYTKAPFSVNTVGEVRMGYNNVRVDVPEGEEVVRKGVWYKNVDSWWIQSQPARQINARWAYSATAKVQSQMTRSYQSRTAQEDANLTSAFFAPAYVTLALGFTYNTGKPKFPVTLTLSALSTNGTVVYNQDLKELYQSRGATSYFGVDIDKHAQFSGGSQVNINFNRNWGKNNWFNYRTEIIAYYGWITNVMNHSKIRDYYNYRAAVREWEAGGKVGNAPAGVPRHVELHPTVGWKNWINIKFAKYFSSSFYYEMQYNKAQNDKVRMNSTLTFGFAYTFKNK
ncbi:MAG: DUF3078 domain-containing protein [Alistipes sp.]|nr:DUF3078 domain-containing protein [Alistipes sp.]